MSIERAIERAYSVSNQRGWPRVYWALDLHGTCLKSNYSTKAYEWLTPDCLPVLKALSELPETNFIIWSSLHQADKEGVAAFFAEAGIKIVGINTNPLEASTETGCFDEKFYMSLIIDDKAGFDSESWPDVLAKVLEYRTRFPLPVESKDEAATELAAAC
jgi:hypothetical protein